MSDQGAGGAGWQPDPHGRHEYRYWDGTAWTDQVSDGGVVSTDPPGDAPTEVTTPGAGGETVATPVVGPPLAGTPTGPPAAGGPYVTPTESDKKLPVGILALAGLAVVAVVAALVIFLGGGDDGGSDNVASTDDLSDLSDLSDASDLSDFSDFSDLSDLPDLSDFSDFSDLSDFTDLFTDFSDFSDDFSDFSDDFSDEATDEEDEPDTDLDGVPDREDPDDDDDGIPDTEDPDDDGDGTPDEEDPGDDGDGGEPGDDDEGPEEEDPPADLDLLRNDPSPAIDAFIDAAGRATPTVEVSLYPTYAFLQVKDADRPQGTLDWAWRDGELEGPEETTPFPGTDLNAETFPLGGPNWDALPRLVANAPERAGLPAGEVTHVIVTSDLPFSNRFLFRIYVTSPNGSDYVVATIDGRPADR